MEHFVEAEGPGLAMPAGIDRSRIVDLLVREWGIAGEVRELGSFEDRILTVDSGGNRFAVKIVDRGRSPDVELEHAAMRRLAAPDFPYDVPKPVQTTGEDPADRTEIDGAIARVLTWVEGRPLSGVQHLDRATLVELGRLTAHSVAALGDLVAPTAPTGSKWDPRHAPEVVADLVDTFGEAERQTLIRAVEPLDRLVRSPSDSLPCQAIHCDITDFNVIGRADNDGAVTPAGLIDFGDIAWSWRACEVAVTCEAIAAREPSDPLPAMLAVLAGYREVQHLDEHEVDAIWPLVLGRAAACAALSTAHVRATPSPYLETMYALDWGAVQALLALPDGLAAAAIRSVFGFAAVRRSRPLADRLARAQFVPLLDGAGPDRLVTVDLGIASPGVTDGTCEHAVATVGDVAASDRIAVGRWGEIRLPASPTPAAVPPATLHLGADIFAPPGTIVRAPLPAVVEALDARELVLALVHEDELIHLRMAGVSPTVAQGQELAAGDEVGTIAAPGDGAPAHVHVQLCTSPGHPGLAVPREHELEAWLALCPDPSPLLGIDAAAPAPTEPAVQRNRRRAVVAGAQKLYYEHPTQIVRGWRQYLYDAYGRPYVDVINNVASVGHAHPSITAAAHRQLRLLNTNSRFLYESMTAYAERVVALLPDELDTVFMVNSGSEACDLAVQLARVYTERRDMIALAGAYHGWTSAVYELCSSPADNPGWRTSIPPFVHVAEQPDPYRGRFGADRDPYVRSLEDACREAAASGGVAGFIAEPLFGNQGALEPPAGYLQAAYATVREHGGVCIADEIQVGYARTGKNFWAFEHEHVVPDIVVAAKAAGNGLPIGLVICRRDIAEAFGRRASFFSSTGGAPVTCEVGLAVLDVIRDERLQENAATVGARLKEDLEAIAARHPIVGAVHGRGLYLGVDLVRERTTKEPWAGAAHRICERLRGLGVIVQPTGDAGNVLKVKPPLCITATDAGYFVRSLDKALTELEQVLL